MSTRVGVDVVDIERFRLAATRRPEILARLFVDVETRRCEKASDPIPHYAARFAAKEAVRKAIGGPIEWRDVWVAVDEAGRPHLESAAPLESHDGLAAAGGSVSLTHDGGMAIAFVVLEFEAT